MAFEENQSYEVSLPWNDNISDGFETNYELRRGEQKDQQSNVLNRHRGQRVHFLLQLGQGTELNASSAKVSIFLSIAIR